MEWAWLAPALSFAAFVLIVLFGRTLPGKGSFLAILGIAGGFIVFWLVLGDFLGQGMGSHPFSINWFEIGDASGAKAIQWGMLIDPLSVIMLGLVTLVAFLVQIYSLGYMAGEERFGWYYAAHALFAGAMLALVLANNFLLLYMAWELVGLGSYLLIGFWYERRSAAEAAKKAFVTTRIGDVGLLIGILILFKATGTFQMTAIFAEAEKLAAGEPSLLTTGSLTAASILIFIGAMGKSAQFPLHVWLPDAMEGPTPVSALIHAATMVAAGVYLVARAFPMFEAAPAALMVVAIIGLITAGMAATMALVMTDLKRVLAYSTISHLGFMMLALGAGSVPAAIFHLLAHAFSKALLFLGAGSVMHGAHQTDIREMGGLRHKMPITAYTFAVGALSLAGIPLFSGFFSKDEIVLAVFHGLSPIFLVLTLLIAFMSAMYMSRALFSVFWGDLKEKNEHVHDAPMTMAVPLLVLSVGAAVLGFTALKLGGYPGVISFLTEGEHTFQVNWGLMLLSIVIALAGFGLGYAIYVRRAFSTEKLIQRFGVVHRLLVNKYYMDDIYQWTINRVVLGVSGFVSVFDRIVVNDGGVNGTADTVRNAGYRLRYLESGMMYAYALAMTLGVVVVALFWWLVIPRIT